MSKRNDQSDDGRDRRQRVQSVEAATGLLDAFVSLGGAATLGAIAAQVGMPPAKAHRYLASLKAAGYVEQVDQSGSYRLGRAATMLGLVALNQSDFVREAESHLNHIRDTLEVTCFAAILGNQGATVVRQAVSSHAVALHVRLGSVLPLDRSATRARFRGLSGAGACPHDARTDPGAEGEATCAPPSADRACRRSKICL